MTAQANDRPRRTEVWKHKDFTLKSGTKAYKGARAALELATGYVIPGATGPGLLALGVFDELVDATSAAKAVSVDLEREVMIDFFVNGTAGDAVGATDVGGVAYMLDDQTVSINPAGKSVAGRIWVVDAIKGVGIERNADLGVAKATAEGAFTANDWAPANITHGAIYDVPTTAGASTITLPAAAPDGTVAYFFADGVKNGHTVQYRDATGSVNLTAALTLSKRHLAIVAKLGGKWAATVVAAP